MDIGTKSLGWSIIGKNKENNEWDIIDFGVRIWDAPEVSKTLDTSAKVRREARSSKRMFRRRRARIKDLKDYLVNELNLISYKEINDHFDKLKEKNDYSVTNKKYRNDINPLFLRYRAIKNEEKLTSLQLIIVLLSFAKRRGYENKFSFEEDKGGYGSSSKKFIGKTEEGNKKYQFPILAIMEDDFFKSNNIGKEQEYFYRNRKNNKINKSDKNKEVEREQILFLTKDNKEELRKILAIQQKFYLELTNERVDFILDEIIFRKRDFEDGPGPKQENLKESWKNSLNKINYYKPFIENVGKCRFVEGEYRTNPFSILGDLFLIQNYLGQVFPKNVLKVKKIDNITLKKIAKEIINEYLNNFVLDEKIFTKILKNNNLIYSEFDNFKKMEKNNPLEQLFLASLAKIKQPFAFKETLKEYLSSINLNELSFDAFENNPINKLGKVLYENKTPSRIVNKIKELEIKNLNPDEVEIWIKKFNDQLKKVKNRTFSVSSKHIFNALEKLLQEGIIISEYQAELEKKQKQEAINKIENNNSNNFLSLPKDQDMKKNAVVFRSINQTRRVLKQIFKTYGPIETVVLETAGDLYNEISVRKRISNQQESLVKEKEERSRRLKALGVNVTGANDLKLRLFDSQKDLKEISKKNVRSIDPYSLYKDNIEYINERDIFTSKYEVDHIIPYSKSNDDSLANKVLVSRTNNQLKGNRTPYQWITNSFGEKAFDNFKKNIKTYYFKGNKNLGKFARRNENLLKKNFSRESYLENETAKINDTRYITSYIANYLELEMEKYKRINGLNYTPEIITLNGNVTSYMRRVWLSNDNWGNFLKPRNITPFHHAIDAIILANLFDKYQAFYSNLILRIEKFYWDQFNFVKKHDIDFETTKSFFENYQNIIEYQIKFATRYFKTEEVEEETIKAAKIAKQNKMIEEVKLLFEYLLINIQEKNVLDFKTDPNINYLFAPIVSNLDEKVENLIPIKISIKEEVIKEDIKQTNIEANMMDIPQDEVDNKRLSNTDKNELRRKNIILEEIVSPQDWAQKNNREIKDFPYISYKENYKRSGNFAKANPIKKEVVLGKMIDFLIQEEKAHQKEVKTIGMVDAKREIANSKARIVDLQEQLKTKNYLSLTKENIDRQGIYVFSGENYYETSEYLGLRFNEETHKFEKYNLFNAIKNGKNKQNKNELLIVRNTTFKLKDEDWFYNYKGFSGVGFAKSPNLLYYSSVPTLRITFKESDKVSEHSPIIYSISSLINKIEGIVEINTLGKYQGIRKLTNL